MTKVTFKERKIRYAFSDSQVGQWYLSINVRIFI